MNSSQGDQEVSSQQGQLTIFLGIALLVTISFLAFIVNVGLFVKAKINLQNATDAAAWAGAAVQARQLSNIAYVNYQFRQIYKEWMFKYYILGNLGGLRGNPTLSRQGNSGITNFRSMRTSLSPDEEVDKYNVPSICINLISGTLAEDNVNICSATSIPGLPRFETVDVPRLGEMNQNFIDEMASLKSADCAKRTNLNFTAAVTWTYGIGRKFVQDAPVPAERRMGAWTKSLLTAVRMRNLEAIVNRPPITQGISGMGIENSVPIRTLQNSPFSDIYNERPIKAFLAAYRNLGGGIKKGADTGDLDELANELILKELAPKVVSVTTNQLGGYLIPEGASYELTEGGFYTEKHYLDLHLMPVNYTIFYSTLLAKERDPTQAVTSGGDMGESGACEKLKTAIPVPSYIMGFTKNHQVLTYYSIKTETRFMGLFFPFYKRLSKGIKLSAYASAKPFGGRIGPQLFKSNGSALLARQREPKKSGAYLVGLTELSPGSIKAGDPLPSSPDFYVHRRDNPVGGVPSGANSEVVFSIPNMIYDFDTNINEIVDSLDPGGGNPFLVLRPEGPAATDPEPSEAKVGLYDWKQFKMFRDNTLGDPVPAVFDSADVYQAVIKSQRPTKYEALNWMLPLKIEDDDGMASPTTAVSLGSNKKKYHIYAPLLGPSMLYKQPIDIVNVVREYMENNQKSMDVFLKSLQDAADNLLSQGTKPNAIAGPEDYEAAAEKIYPLLGPTGSKETVQGTMSDGDRVFTCSFDPSTINDLPMASKFYYFFKPDDAVSCPGITPLLLSFREVISDIEQNDIEPNYITADYLGPEPLKTPKELSTAYSPGPAHGGDRQEKGNFISPFQNKTVSHKRNYYSTKFVHTEKLLASGGTPLFGKEGNLYQEFYDDSASFTDPNDEDFPKGFVNYIDENHLKEFTLNSFGRLAY